MLGPHTHTHQSREPVCNVYVPTIIHHLCMCVCRVFCGTRVIIKVMWLGCKSLCRTTANYYVLEIMWVMKYHQRANIVLLNVYHKLGVTHI